MRMKVRVPTKGSVITLKARAEKGSSSEAARMISVSLPSSPSSQPTMSGRSRGEGRKSHTASRRGCTPLFLKAVPHTMGTKVFSRVPLRMSALSAASSGSSPSRNIIMASSSCSTAISTIFSRYSFACSCSSGRISLYSKEAPRSSPIQRISCIVTRSMTPSNWSSAPMGSWMMRGLAPRLLTTMSAQRRKLAPMRSILFTKQMRGTPYLSAWRHTVSDWGSTPDTASKQHTAPSSTRRARSTSRVKST
mmetsp:Transcript_27923/g.61100  ORF Transcript_27923/g.61100 Transcript_27923/m.61100 type:complete len:249 (+) Transcript_27923:1296-2042(+)